MSDLRADLKKELNNLVAAARTELYLEGVRASDDGRADLDAEVTEARKRFERLKRRKLKEQAGDRLTHLEAIRERVRVKDFGERYQKWYSKTLPIVEQILPDRYVEFREHYRLEKRPKELDVTTYTIYDYLQGTRVTRGTDFYKEDVFDAPTVAIGRFKSQIEILDSASDRLESRLSDISGVLEAGLLDEEVGTSRELLKAGHLRAAGVVTGVVLERHLKRVIDTHKIDFRKKAQIANLNDALKAAGIYGVPQWRRIQHLGDLRNVCGHDADRDPTSDEVGELIDGVQKVITTVF